MVACAVMLTACASSPTRPAIAADPIVEKRTVIRTVCPAEVTAPLPATIAAYVGAAIEAPQAYFDWLTAHLRREKLLGERLADAAKGCGHD